MLHTGLVRLGKVTDHAWTSFTGCWSKIIIARQHSMHAECNISFSKAVKSVRLTLVLYLNEQWSNCGETWGTAFPFRFWWRNAVPLAYTTAVGGRGGNVAYPASTPSSAKF